MLGEDEDYVVLEAKFKLFQISEGFEAYQKDDQFFLPLSEITGGFEFPIVVDVLDGTAKGWFINEGRSFDLDLKKGQAKSDSKYIELSNENVLWGEEDIYVSSFLLDSFFPITTAIDPSSLILNIKSLEIMPFEKKIEREKRQKRIGQNNKEKLKFSDPFLEN